MPEIKTIAFDTETHLITPGNLTPKLVCISFYDFDRGGWLEKAEEGLNTMRGFLEDERYLFTGHNVAFDFGVLAAARPSLMPLIFKAYSEFRVYDTKIREELNDIARGRITVGTKHMVMLKGKLTPCDYSLAGLARRYLNKDRSADKENPDSWRFRYAELENVPLAWWPEEAKKYALEDAEDTYDISWNQREFPEDMFTHINAAWALHLMSAHGMRTDGEAVAKLEIELLSEQKKNRARLIKAGILKGKKMTPKELREGKVPDYYDNNKPYRWAKDMGLIKQYVERVYSRRGMKPPLTETGNVATDKDTLNESGSLLLSLLSDAGGVDKILQTYIPVLKQGIHTPINARFNVLVSSGRTSCLAWWTRVKTKRGFVSIKDVQIGDEVWTHKARWRKVTAVLDQGVKDILILSLEHNSEVRFVNCTADHRFLMKDGEWKEAVKIQLNEIFEGSFFLTSVTPDTSVHVFDISVEEDESFEIEDCIFSHNCQNPNLQNLPTGRRVSGVRECFIPRETVEVIEVPDDYVLQEGEEWDE